MSKIEIKEAYIYVVTTFPAKPWSEVDDFLKAIQNQKKYFLDQDGIRAMKHYPDLKNFVIEPKENKMSDEEKMKGESLLRNYTSLDHNRLSPKYRKENAFIRLGLSSSVCEQVTPEFIDLGERVTVAGGILTLFFRGVGMITWKIKIENSSVDALSLCHRKKFRSKIENCMAKLLKEEVFLPKNFSIPESEDMDLGQDTFFLTVARDVGFEGEKLLDYIQQNQDDFYSLNSGLGFHGQYVAQKSFDKLWKSNLSTRNDTFFTLNFRHGLIVESNWKRSHFTKQRLEKGAKKFLLEEREEYNDLNYLIWIEVMFYQRCLLSISYEVLNNYHEAPVEQRSIFEILTLNEKINELITNLQASQITVFETYQDWIEHGKKAMKIDSFYQSFCDRIARIDNSIQTKYHYEQITEQNHLAEIGILISKLGLFFCALELIKIFFESLKQDASYELIAYSIFVISFVVYLVLSFKHLKQSKEES